MQRYLPTIGIDYGSTTVDVDDQKVSVHFFDTSGSPLFEEVTYCIIIKKYIYLVKYSLIFL